LLGGQGGFYIVGFDDLTIGFVLHPGGKPKVKAANHPIDTRHPAANFKANIKTPAFFYQLSAFKQS
jgi:hypothetical protein